MSLWNNIIEGSLSLHKSKAKDVTIDLIQYEKKK